MHKHTPHSTIDLVYKGAETTYLQRALCVGLESDVGVASHGKWIVTRLASCGDRLLVARSRSHSRWRSYVNVTRALPEFAVQEYSRAGPLAKATPHTRGRP